MNERDERTSNPGSGPWTPSVELAAWIAIGVVAVGIRALNLDGAPLQANESEIALDSWRILQRTGLTIAPSPLLIYANVLIFLMLGATDATARLLPMVAGSLVALSPIAFRPRIGRFGSLVAGITLATSPTMIIAARQVDSTMLSLALAIALVLLLTPAELGREPRRLYPAAAVLALLLVSGPTAFSLLVILGGFVAIARWRGRGESKSGVENRSGDAEVALNSSFISRLGLTAGAARGALMTGGLVYLIVSTGLGTNPIGLGDAIAGPLSLWRSALLGKGPPGLVTIPTLVLGYEPLATVFGVVGAVIGARRKNHFEEILVWWAIVGGWLYALTTGFHPTWFAIALTPLAFLAGLGCEHLARSMVSQAAWRPIALFVTLGLSVLASTLIALGNVSLPDPNVPMEILILPALAAAILVLSFVSRWGWPTTRAAIVVVGFVALIALNIHAAMFLNPGASLNPAEAYAGTATSPDVRTLASDVSVVLDELQIGRKLEGRPVTDTVEIADPIAQPLAWYLRQWPQTEIVTSVADAPAIAVVPSQTRAPRGAYAGETFQVASTASLPRLVFKEIVRWWLYRQPPSRTDSYVKVFVKTQLGRP